MAVTLKANRREQSGSRHARRLRREGLIPAVIYGHGEDTVSVSINEHEIEMAVQHGERLLEVELDGQHQNVLISDIQFDTFGMSILHADLTRVDLDERVELSVPIVLKGTPAGAEEGGVLQQPVTEVTVECTVRSMPEQIEASVAQLNIGDNLSLGDLELPEGVKLIGDPDLVFCSVTFVAEEPEEAEGVEEVLAEPEIIGEQPEGAEGAEGEPDKETGE